MSEFDNTTIYGIGIVPAIIMLVSIATSAGLPKKWAPLLAIVVGVFLGVFFLKPDTWQMGLIQGTFLGLSASGLYSGAKTAKEASSDQGQ